LLLHHYHTTVTCRATGRHSLLTFAASCAHTPTICC
jgi:hypothetical protein